MTLNFKGHVILDFKGHVTLNFTGVTDASKSVFSRNVGIPSFSLHRIIVAADLRRTYLIGIIIEITAHFGKIVTQTDAINHRRVC